VKLTERKIEKLTPETGRKDRLVFDDEQRGLAVRVTSSGGRTYLCQYTLHGHKWRVPLGACAAVPLAKARQAAAAIMGDVAKGQNPAAQRKEAVAAERAKRARNRLTLRVLIEDWRRLHLAERRPSYAAEAVRALHYAFADCLDDAAEDLDRVGVVRALDALRRRRKRKDGNETSKGAAMTGRTAAYGRAAFAWAVKLGAVQHNPFAELPVAKSIGKRERILSDQELADVWRAAGEVSAPYGAIVRLLILTGQRRGEVAGMTRAELSEDLTTWTLPGERTKNGIIHAVPLSGAAQGLLKELAPDDTAKRRSAELLLPGIANTPFSSWSKAKRALDKTIADARKGGNPSASSTPWNVHDLRRTVATGLQRLGVRLEVTEAILNHISGSRGGIAGVYQRHDWASEKRAALDAWASHVVSLTKHRPVKENVLKLRAR
jgi:integrase